MPFQLIKFVLLPILLTQAIYTKLRIPRLIEATGERQGIQGFGIQKKLLIIGDSAAAGVGTDLQSNALAGNLCHQLANQGYEVHWKLFATTGHSLKEIILELKDIPPQSFDFIIVSSGVNDILKQHSLKIWEHHCKILFMQLQDQFNQPHILFSSVPPMQKFAALPKTLAWYLGRQATSFNLTLKNLDQKWSKFHFVNITFPFTPEFLATDGFHPSNKAYALWAESLITYIKSSQLL